MNNEEIMGLRQAHFFPNQLPYYKDPIQLVRASGSYVWDEKGKPYLDAIGGIVSISVGHNHPRIKERIKEIDESTTYDHEVQILINEVITAVKNYRFLQH